MHLFVSNPFLYVDRRLLVAVRLRALNSASVWWLSTPLHEMCHAFLDMCVHAVHACEQR